MYRGGWAPESRTSQRGPPAEEVSGSGRKRRQEQRQKQRQELRQGQRQEQRQEQHRTFIRSAAADESSSPSPCVDIQVSMLACKLVRAIETACTLGSAESTLASLVPWTTSSADLFEPPVALRTPSPKVFHSCRVRFLYSSSASALVAAGSRELGPAVSARLNWSASKASMARPVAGA